MIIHQMTDDVALMFIKLPALLNQVKHKNDRKLSIEFAPVDRDTCG